MSKASPSQIQQLPVSRPFQPSQLPAVRNPACIRWPLRNQTAGMLSGSTGIVRPSCATQPSGNGSGICIRCDGERRRTIAQPDLASGEASRPHRRPTKAASAVSSPILTRAPRSPPRHAFAFFGVIYASRPVAPDASRRGWSRETYNIYYLTRFPA